MNETYLNFHPKNNNKRLHIGLIPDGGRRWAKINNTSLSNSYATTRDLIVDFTNYFFTANITELSVYLSSAHNFRRSEYEIGSFTEVASNAIGNELISLVKKLNLKVNIAGDISSISKKMMNTLYEYNSSLGSDVRGTINLCISYNPIEEINHAMDLGLQNGDSFINHLWVKNPLDLVIRSGGANLMSNFLPLQSGFARYYFLDELFNDVSLEKVKSILDSFKNLDRKYGE